MASAQGVHSLLTGFFLKNINKSDKIDPDSHKYQMDS